MPKKKKRPELIIGEKLRAAREQRHISLRELATQTNMSASMLSQIENGKTFPSVPSIYNIAAVLELPVDYFFPDSSENGEAPSAEKRMTASDLRVARLDNATDARTPEFPSAHPSAHSPLMHRTARPTISLRGGVAWARLTALAEQGAEFLEITYAPGATSGVSLSHHVGREFGLILEGELVVELGFERYALKAGDSIIFDSTTPHRLTNECKQPMRALWVVLNPTGNKEGG